MTYPLFQELQNQREEGTAHLKRCEQHGEATIAHTGTAGCQAIQQQLESLRQAWEEYAANLEQANSRLADTLHKWQVYEEAFDSLMLWLKDTERKTKESTLGATLDGKKAQVKRVQVCRDFDSNNLK